MSSDKIVKNGSAAPRAREDYPYPVPAKYPAEEPASFAEILLVVRRRRWTILGAVAAGLALALAVSLIMTPKYEATSIVEVNKESSDLLGLESLALANAVSSASDSLDYSTSLQTQANALQKRFAGVSGDGAAWAGEA